MFINAHRQMLMSGCSGHGGALQLAVHGLCSKGFISTDGEELLSPGGSRFLCSS